MVREGHQIGAKEWPWIERRGSWTERISIGTMRRMGSVTGPAQRS